MKAKRRIAWLLSFLMVFSLIMGTSKMQVFAAGGAGETATFEIRESNAQTGTVQYKLNGSGDFTTANNNTPVNLEGVTSITIKVIPTGEAKVNQNNSGITGTGQPATFDYDALISESGWTYNIQDNDGDITFTIEFDNNDGTGGESNPGGGENPGENAASYSVDFGEGSWIVGDVTVTADKSGEQTLSESDIITLTGFDAETMEARVDAEDGFGTTLTVTDGQTSISAHTNDGGVPTDITFSVVGKSSEPGGGENPGENAASYSVDFGTGSWIVGDVTVTADKSGEQTLSESDIITLTGFDAETMEVRVVAEDGFSTTLAVNNNQTSISAKTNDGVVPTDIAFSVVEKSSNPGGGGEMPGGNSDVVKIQIGNSSPGANGTVMYKFDIDAEFTSVTSTQADAGGNILVAIPGEATSITIKAVPNDDYTVRRGGCRLYVDDENVINEDNINTYYDALIADGYVFSLHEGLPVFVLDFGEPEIDLWYAISWGGGNVTVENGQIMYHRVYVGDVTYTTIPEEVNESSNIYAIDTIEGDMEACLRTYGVAIVGGTDLFVMPDVSDVYVEFVLVPDYGYQVTDIITNETESLLNEFNPIEQISTYKFEYITNTNVHFNVMFSETEDIINVGSGNTNITGGAISGGENIIDTGNLQMDVDEVDKNTVSNTIKEEVGDFDAIFLNIDLNQIVSKGAGRGNWTTPLTELENEVTISLDVAGYDSNKTYYIVREHDGTCDRLEATYNTTTGKLEFATDKFSTYAIICTDAQTSGGEGENVFYIDFGTGSWSVGDVTVSAPEDMSDVVPMLDTDTISTGMLENFDPDTMDAVLIVDEDVTLRLNVDENGNTRLADVDGGVEALPPYGATLTFAVVEKSSNPGGGENPGENVYYIDLGTGSWTVGDVTVSAPEGMSDVVPMLDTETIPTGMLENFDPETMDITLTVSDGFVIYLEIDENGNTTLASTRDGVELPPYGATLTFAVVEKASNPGGGENPGENVYYIDLGTGSWTVGDVTVSTPEGMSGVVSMLDTETIPTGMLENFDPETMDITLTTGDGFVIYLEIDENGNTTLASTRDGVELPPYGETLTFAVVAKPGNMEIVDRTEENACNADLPELTDELIRKILADAEKTRLENGEDVKVWLETTDISATVSQTDKDLIYSKKGNATIGIYLDIDLLKQIGADSPVKITATNGAVTITLKVPSSLINSNSSVTRTYQMLRVHNGVATVIPCTYNAANQTISCETDQFSTYALAYVDQQNNSGGGNTGGGSTDSGNTGGGSTDSGNTSGGNTDSGNTGGGSTDSGNTGGGNTGGGSTDSGNTGGGNTGGGSAGDGSNDNVKDVVPKTGDASNAYVWFMLALVSGIAALYFGKKGLVLKKEN